MARKPPPTPPIEIKTFTPEEIDRAVVKLNKRLHQVSQLDPEKLAYNDQIVKNAESDITTSILEIFGPNSPEFRKHQHHNIWEGPIRIGMSTGEAQRNFARGVEATKKMISGLIQRLEEKKEDVIAYSGSAEPIKATSGSNKNLFIVHGRNSELKETIARFVTRINLNPIILHEKPNQGNTLIEKFEANSDVGFAIVILSADDVGTSKDNLGSSKDRARQNVIFEFGYFVGKLGRKNVCAIYQEGVEFPSDINGLAYIPWDTNWKMQLVQELKAAGYCIDANKAFDG